MYAFVIFKNNSNMMHPSNKSMYACFANVISILILATTYNSFIIHSYNIFNFS